MIKAVIFDLDGLLVNSEPIHREATTLAGKKFGFDRSKLPKDISASILGLPSRESIKIISAAFGVSDKAEEIYKRKQDILIRLTKEKCEMMPGALHALDLCKNLKLKIAIASSGTIEYINVVLDKFKIKDYFSVIVSCNDVSKNKPNPEIFLYAAMKLRVKPDECVVFEDADNGIKAARTAKMKCIAIRSKFSWEQKLKEADLIKESLRNINETDILRW